MLSLSWRLFLGLGLMVTCTVANAETLHVVVLIGQSNAAGRSIGSSNGTSYDMKYVSHDVNAPAGFDTSTTGEATVVKKLNGEPFGPEVGIAKSIRTRYPHSNLAIFKYVQRGTALNNRWNPRYDESFSGEKGELYRGLKTEFDSFANAQSETVKVAGIAWVQGEWDARQEKAVTAAWSSAATPGGLDKWYPTVAGGSTSSKATALGSDGEYQKRLKVFVEGGLMPGVSGTEDAATGIRDRLSIQTNYRNGQEIPFIYSNLSNKLDYEASSIVRITSDHRDQLRVQQSDAESEMSNAIMVDTGDVFLGLSKTQIYLSESGNFIHYKESAMEDLGEALGDEVTIPGDTDGDGWDDDDFNNFSSDLDNDSDSDSADFDLLLDYAGLKNGDANRDGFVDFDDFLTLSGNFGDLNASWTDGDFNRDGEVEFGDFLILSGNFEDDPAMISGGP